MSTPKLEELPSPPPGKTGWPWTVATPQLPDLRPDGSPLPRVSIVTPSFNQGIFIEETIRSVLLQGYPNLEYFIMDGGSTDRSVEVVQKYSKWLTGWVSEKDRGQSHAINKGFELSSGDLISWLNSDDYLLPGAVFRYASIYNEHPEQVLLGDVINFEDSSDHQEVIQQKVVTLKNMVAPCYSGMSWHQPGIYAPRSLAKIVGPLDESLRYLFDQDWMCRLLQRTSVSYLNQPVVKFRLHGESKTVAETPEWWSEQLLILKRYWDFVPGLDKNFALARLELYAASIHFSVGYWDRRKGIAHLFEALRASPKISLHPVFQRMVLRGLLPFRFLRFAKKFRLSMTG